MGEDKETQKRVKEAMASHAKIVVGDEATRQERAMKEIQGILAKYNVSLVPRAMISPQGIEFMIETMVNKPPPKEKKGAVQKGKAKGKAKKKNKKR